ncbi:MAG: hypothetical protein Q8R28_16315, partial [Dehalococcoidia bacterium]|nr:hypothetical protein [Dehalococcoidia bacterium]
QQVKWIGKDAGKKFGGIGFMLTTGSIGEVLGSPADNPSEIKDGEVMVVWGGYVPLRRSTITPGEKGKKWELFGELLPHIRPGQFVIKQMGPNQVKVSRSDRKGEFFLEFGPPVVPEGPTGAEPASLAGVLASLGFSRLEARFVETGATVRIFDDDPRAPHLWQMWQDFEAESPPYSTQTGSSPLRPAMPATEVVSLEGVVSKWEQAKARNSVTARRDLESLQRAGVEVDDALDALDNYQGIERSDYEEAEEYSEERTSAWDEFLDALRDLEPPEENDLEAESPPYSTQTGSSPRHAALEAGYRKVITRELGQSVAEEKQAQEVYGKRAHTADAAGDTETGSIYREIAGDEYSHQVGFEQRLEEVQRPKLLPALQPYDEYQFARYVLLNNAFSKEDIPDYSGLSGKNPHGVPAAVWARAMSDMSGQFVKEGNWYKVFNNEVEAPPRMRGRPAYMVGPGGGLPLLPDSREWMAQTIADSGWREKLDAAFEAAIARARS